MERSADLGLAALVFVALCLMIVPLPTWVLDVLLAANLSFSLAILLVVLYVPDAVAIAAFPTVLLLTTLFRLSLNVASTRLVLLQADAGEVIRAFGTMVVRSNYVVGAVMFLVLTIVQLVVIAKGAERVAEVGARFALDALPGKQLAIDAELRSGAIDGHEARRRRRALARESQFYGAMDGAMKFVKGDAIASLVITLVNVIGGLGVGVLQRGLPVTGALHRYALLAIGDGLVTQVPALVLSTAAGILVTRVASDEAETPLGPELARQLLRAPKALRVASFFVASLAIVPGLPAAPFLLIGAGLFALARARTRQLATETQDASVKAEPQRDGQPPAFVPMVVPWSVEVGGDLAPLVAPGGLLRDGVLALRSRIFAELGVPLPPPRVRVDPDLPSRHAVIAIHEIPTSFALPEGLDDAALSALVVTHAHALLTLRAADFLGLAETQRLLDDLETMAPAAVRNVVPKPLPLPVLVDVLRRLVEERVSIRDLRAILDALALVANAEKDPLNLAEYVRGQLRRAITHRLTRGTGTLEVLLLDPIFEEAIRDAITRTAAGSFLALPPHAARDILSALRATTASVPRSDPPYVLLTPPDIRRFVRKLVEADLPGLDVVSHAELLPEVTLVPVGKASPVAPPEVTSSAG